MTTPHRINGWLEAAIAWNVCASIHERFAKRKDALYTTRHKDFVARAKAARKKARAERAEAERDALRADAERYREWRRAFREDVMLGVDDDEAKEIQNDYSDS